MGNISFSIIIPTFNRKYFLAKAIKSIFAQHHSDWEIIVVDDGSTDGTDEMMQEYDDKRIRYLYQGNRGVSFARNRAIEQAKFEWLVFLDSDDWFTPFKLQKTAEYIQQYSDIKLFHTEEVWYKDGEVFPQKLKHRNPDGWVYKDVLPICCISMSTAVIHRSIFNDVGLFDEEFDACEDYDFWLRVTHKYPVKLIPQALTEKDGGRSDQLSLTTWGMDRFRIKALSKILDSGNLSQDNWDLTFCELQRKALVYIKGAAKRNKDDEVKFYEDLIEKYALRTKH